MGEKKENKMGVMPIKQLIISMSVPMMISMLVQALYNIVDSYFVGQYDGTYGVAALTIAFPLQGLMIAFGSGTGVGINALLSRCLGQKNYEKANSAANAGILLAIFNALLFLILGLTITTPYIHSQAKSVQTVIYTKAYMQIVMCMSLGLFCQMTFERLLQATGRTQLSMISQMTGAIINIGLDYMMIFGHGPFPEMGVAGAAYATVIGQSIAAMIGLILNLRYNKEIQISIGQILHPWMNTIREIYFVGIPTIAMMSVGSVMTYLMNLILGRIGGEDAISVFGIYFKLQSFFFMPVFGLNNGIIPILAYNYGAQKKKRIEDALKFAILLAACIMVAGTVCFLTIPGRLMEIFNASAQVEAMGVTALRIISFHFPLAAVGIVLGSVFQAFSESVYSLIISLCRQIVVLIPVAFLLSLSGNVNLVWFSFLVAEIVSLTFSLIFFRKIYKKRIAPIQES
jgi:putative MATE family efflux protein